MRRPLLLPSAAGIAAILGLAGCAAPPEAPLGPVSRANFHAQLDRPRDAQVPRTETPRRAHPPAQPAAAASPAPSAVVARTGGAR